MILYATKQTIEDLNIPMIEAFINELTTFKCATIKCKHIIIYFICCFNKFLQILLKRLNNF